MEEQEHWVKFQDIDWDCPNFNNFNVDTRDFHCGYINHEETPKKVVRIFSRLKYRFTKEQVIEFIERMFVESGGEGKWRFLSTSTYGDNWSLKYIRIYRKDFGYFICDRDNNPLNHKQTKGLVIGKPTLNFIGK